MTNKNKWLQLSLRKPFFAILILFFVVAMAAIGFRSVKRSAFPLFSQKTIEVSASLRGASSEEVEMLLTYPMERVLRGTPQLEEITSVSRSGSAQITLKLIDSTTKSEIEKITSSVNSKINTLLSTLPKEMSHLKVEHKERTDVWFASLSFIGFQDKNPSHLAWYQQFEEKLYQIPGINRIQDYHQWPKVLVKFNPQKLAELELLPSDIEQIIRSFIMLKPMGSALTFTSNKTENLSFTWDFKHFSLDQLRKLNVGGNSSSRLITLGEIASVDRYYPAQKTVWQTDNLPTSFAELFTSNETDLIDLKQILQTYLKSNPHPQGEIEVKIFTDGASYINRQLIGLLENSLWGFAIIFLLMWVLLGIKIALLTTLSIPLSYFIVIGFMGLFHIPLNLISVIGIVVILGLLVDDAIIVTEEYARSLEGGASPAEASLISVKKSFLPITGSLLTTMVAFFPLGLSGTYLSSIFWVVPLVVMIGLTVSWLDCFFLLPHHLKHFIKPKPHTSDQSKDRTARLFKNIQNAYLNILRKILKWRYPLVIMMLGIFTASYFLAFKKVQTQFNLRMGWEYLRVMIEFSESSNFFKDQGLQSGENLSLEAIYQKHQLLLAPVISELKRELGSNVDAVETSMGSYYYLGQFREGPNLGQIILFFHQDRKNLSEVKDSAKKYLESALSRWQQTPGIQKMAVEKVVQGHQQAKNQTITLKLKSSKLLNWQALEGEIRQSLEPLGKAIKDIYLPPQMISESYNFKPNYQQLVNFNITEPNLSGQIARYLNPVLIGFVPWEDKVVELLMGFQMPHHSSSIESNQMPPLPPLIEQTLQQPVILPLGKTAKVAAFGNFEKNISFNEIHHHDLKRSVNVDIAYDEHLFPQKEVIQEKVQSLIEPLGQKFPHIYFTLSESDPEAKKNQQSITRMLLIALCFIALILSLTLGSVMQALNVLLAIPFGLTGVFFAFYLHQETFGVLAMVGVMGLMGVAVNDSLCLTFEVLRLKKEWDPSEWPYAIMQGSANRVRAILLTSLTTFAGLFPMAYGLGTDAGFMKPLALAMGYGLLLSTILTLFILPCILYIQAEMSDWWNSDKKSEVSPSQQTSDMQAEFNNLH